MSQIKTAWVSFYIYYKPLAGDTLLRQHIWPVVKRIMAKKWASQFFFMRYFDRRGPHIRLRFKGEKELLEAKIIPLLLAKFKNNPVRLVKYIPEIKRYGGKTAITIAEEQFEASSRVVLARLSQNKNWSYEQALSTALQLQFGMAHTIGMRKEEAIAFFEHLATHDETQKFEKNLKKQRKTLLPYLASLWNTLEEKRLFEEQWFNGWLEDIKQIASKLDKAKQSNKLAIEKNPHHQNPLWSLYESYVHMTNNRLGVINADEPYIAYILANSLKKV